MSAHPWRRTRTASWSASASTARAFKALRVNHMLHGRHRSPFIANRALRWAMLLITAATVGLAVMGWMLS